jgi:hypothetical protein
MKRYNVGFVVVVGCENVSSPFIVGTLDSIWVWARGSKLAIEEAKDKLMRCYGWEGKDFVVYG